MSYTDGETDVGTPNDVGAGVAIGENSPFAIDDTTTDELVDTANLSNVDDGVNNHVNDGAESTVPDKGTDDKKVFYVAIPWKKPSRPMASKPEVPKISKRKSSPLLYFHIFYISIVSRRTIEMRIMFYPFCISFSSQTSAGG
jgi:hypothetical protein